MLTSANPIVANALAMTSDEHKRMVIRPTPSASASTATHAVGKEELREAVVAHRRDVRRGMERMAEIIRKRGAKHDWTKMEFFDEYYDHFAAKQKGEVRESDWRLSDWAAHYHTRYERHHIEDAPPEDINLIDVIEHIVDSVVSGKGRGGHFNADILRPGLLDKAYANTQKMLADMVEVED